jgi:hypothetical protein
VNKDYSLDLHSTTPFQFGVIMSIHDNSTHKSKAINNKDIAMSTDKTPNISPPDNTINNPSTGEIMKTSDTAPDTPHHQYYAYGEREEEWIPGTYREPYFWASPDTLPYSRNHYSLWEGLPMRRTIGKAGLPTFIRLAIPISKEEYDRLTEIKCNRQEADSRAEYMWSGPDYDRD